MKRLVVVAPNWLGDAVMALPAIADVRRGLPDVSMTVAARAPVAPLFTLVHGVDEVVTLPGTAKPALSALSGCDAALLLPNSFHAALMAVRAGIPERWGYRTDWRGLLLTRAMGRPAAGLHQVEYYQRLVRALDFPGGPSVPRLDLPPGLQDAGAAILTRAGWDGRRPLVALAPGAAYGSAKRWPPAAFADLVAGLAADRIGAVIVGAAADAATATALVRALADRAPVINLVGRTDLPTLAAVLATCRTLVTNDSGAMHLAAALGVSVTAVFGPTDERTTAPMDGGQWAVGDGRWTVDGGQWPVGGGRPPATEHRPPITAHRSPPVTILTHAVWCRPCMLRECPLDHACMRGVGVPAVLAAARRMR